MFSCSVGWQPVISFAHFWRLARYGKIIRYLHNSFFGALFGVMPVCCPASLFTAMTNAQIFFVAFVKLHVHVCLYIKIYS